jgi:glutamate racemase
MKIAILDWGIGGLGFYKFFKTHYPNSPVIYWSDAGWTPYGLAPKKQLQQRIKTIAKRLAEQNATVLVLACNAASSAFRQNGTEPLGLDCGGITMWVTGVIAPAIQRCLELDVEKIGIIGGRRTILSRVYQRQLAAAGYLISQRVAQPLSAHIENGDIDSPALHRDLSSILTPLRGIQALVMGCTHYPAIKPALSYHLPGIEMIDPAQETMNHFQKWWRPTRLAGADEFVTTGNPAEMVRAAASAFQLILTDVRQEAITL